MDAEDAETAGYFFQRTTLRAPGNEPGLFGNRLGMPIRPGRLFPKFISARCVKSQTYGAVFRVTREIVVPQIAVLTGRWRDG
jgi:hypothetical protein